MVARLSTDENWEELFKVMSVYSLGLVRPILTVLSTLENAYP